MSGRQNSAAVYHQIKEEGLLSEMRWQVYDVLFHHGPATASELAKEFPPSPGGRGAAGNIHARLGELIDREVAQIVGNRLCTVTSREVAVFDVTDQLPGTPPAKPKKLLSKSSVEGLRKLYVQVQDVADRNAIQRTVELVRQHEQVSS